MEADADRTWAFFSSADNLPRITPPWLRFKVLTPAPVRIGPDSLLDYTIRWKGVPLRWRTKIIDWQPPTRFVDLQLRGPYAMWHHQHAFVPLAEGGVSCADRVIYRLPFSLLGRIAHAALVKRQLLDIFRFRRGVIGQHLGWRRAVQPDVQIDVL